MGELLRALTRRSLAVKRSEPKLVLDWETGHCAATRSAGTVIGRNMQRHRHQELIRFSTPPCAGFWPESQSTRSSTTTPPPSIPLCGDDWRAIHAGRSSASASLLNAAEGLFAILTKRRLKRGVFRNA